jgi:hypothetical protein
VFRVLTVVLLLAATAGAQDWAKERLLKSPRHQGWARVKAILKKM